MVEDINQKTLENSEENYIIIKDTKYKQPDLEGVAEVQNNLNEGQRNILLHILKKHQSNFKAERGN